MDAQEANLVEKPNLRHLELSWELDSESESQEKVEKVFEALQPHSNLEILKIEGYKGAKFPVWMDYQILSNVVSITLSNCENCRQLPPLWQLPRLRYLTIINLINLEYIDTSFQGERKFPSLEELCINGLSRLQRLSRQDGSELFSCLTKLKIYGCPELTTLPCLPSAKFLCISSCNGELLKSISHFRSLTVLILRGICDLVYLPHGILQNLSSLRRMSIKSFKKLKELATDRVRLNGLKSLTISECPELEAFPEQVLEGLNSLQHLSLERCMKFSNLSEGLRHLSALESLTLNGCPELVTFPSSVKYLSSLRELTMCGEPASFFAGRNSNGICDVVFATECGEEHNNCPKLTVLPESMSHHLGSPVSSPPSSRYLQCSSCKDEEPLRLAYLLMGKAAFALDERLHSIMGTLPMHHLSGLSEDECWLLFKERAFGQEKEERPNLVAIGKEIVKKCSGVPLAVKSLGSLMPL
ncbi:hypothetical protein Patl1_10147 [Pistacia atlantica]|uniref:Uncharacterized protein n=1 Tax=Pistacia atlantica TaxID=434234 RepID=A0ACC1A628_9ROSI|nr:hypothetical protein Patl1_10147 [Pistacia atlantica]